MSAYQLENTMITSTLPAASTREMTHEKVKTTLTKTYCIILYNDEHNTFPHVIKSLMEVCDHSAEQAEQCAWIVHFKGKYAIKTGDREDMMTRCVALLDRGLSAEVVLV